MTVYPFILHLGPLEITGYGIMMMVGFLVGGWLIALELRRRGLYEEYAADITVAAVIGGSGPTDLFILIGIVVSALNLFNLLPVEPLDGRHGPELGPDADELVRGGIDGDLARAEQEPPGDHALGVRADSLGGVLGADGGAHGKPPQAALTTFRERRQRVHTRMYFAPPFTCTFTRGLRTIHGSGDAQRSTPRSATRRGIGTSPSPINSAG